MSVVPKTMRSMRIIALPLTRPGGLGKTKPAIAKTGKSDPTLTYYHFQLTSPHDPNADAGDKDQGRLKKLAKWASTKAAETWAGFGKAPEGNWKLRTYQYGERLVDRMDFEELALKGIDPSLGPTITHPDISGKDGEKMGKEEDVNKLSGSKRTTIPLVYPPFLYPTATASTTPHPSLLHLQSLISTRKPRHRKGFYTWMIIAPFTAPFMIVPIIPNLPFFFCVWRSWSHYRAYRSTQYLETLIDHGAIVPEASEALDKLYIENNPSNTPTSSPATPDAKSETLDGSAKPNDERTKPIPPNLLLTRSAIPAILSLFNLSSSSSADIYRAVEQARLRSEDGSQPK